MAALYTFWMAILVQHFSTGVDRCSVTFSSTFPESGQSKDLEQTNFPIGPILGPPSQLLATFRSTEPVLLQSCYKGVPWPTLGQLLSSVGRVTLLGPTYSRCQFATWVCFLSCVLYQGGASRLLCQSIQR